MYKIHELQKTLQETERQLRAMEIGANKAMQDFNQNIPDLVQTQGCGLVALQGIQPGSFCLDLFFCWPQGPQQGRAMVARIARDGIPTEIEAYREVAAELSMQAGNPSSPLMTALASLRMSELAMAKLAKEQPPFAKPRLVL